MDHRRPPPGGGMGLPGMPPGVPQSSVGPMAQINAPSQMSMANQNMPPASSGNFVPGVVRGQWILFI